jgi:hypothetical protein
MEIFTVYFFDHKRCCRKKTGGRSSVENFMVFNKSCHKNQIFAIIVLVLQYHAAVTVSSQWSVEIV